MVLLLQDEVTPYKNNKVNKKIAAPQADSASHDGGRYSHLLLLVAMSFLDANTRHLEML